MAKIAPVTRELASDEQRRIADPIFAARGGKYSGPWAILLHDPKLTERAGALGDYVRDGLSLPKRLSELVIVMTARHWTAQFEWAAHHHQGIEAGLDPEVLEAIRVRERPVFSQSDEAAVYDYVTALYGNAGIPDDVHRRTVELVGEIGVIGIVAISGFYTTIAFLINACDIEVDRSNPPAPLP